MMRLRVTAMVGELTRFQVESAEVQCTNPACSKLYRRTPNGHARFGAAQQTLLNYLGLWKKVKNYLKQREKEYNPKYIPGAQCPRCGAVLAERFHTVDTAAIDYHGQCSCEWFVLVAMKELRKQSKAQRGIGEWRCSHIDAARDFDYDLRLRLGEHYRLNGHKEEDTI